MSNRRDADGKSPQKSYWVKLEESHWVRVSQEASWSTEQWLTFVKFDRQLSFFVLPARRRPDILLQQEDNIEDTEEDSQTAHTEHQHVAELVLQEGPQRKTCQEADGYEAVQDGEPPGPGVRVGVGDVHHEGVGGQVEGGATASQVLQALQQ